MNKIIKQCVYYLGENKCKLYHFCHPAVLLKHRPEIRIHKRKDLERMCWDVTTEVKK